MRGNTTARIERISTGRVNKATGSRSAAVDWPSKICMRANQTQNPPQRAVSSDAPQLMQLLGIVSRGWGSRGRRIMQGLWESTG